MKITGDFEDTIVKMIREETTALNEDDDCSIEIYYPIEIYEVEEWACDSFDTNIDGYSEHFTTLDEAEKYFEEVTKGYYTDYDECYADYDEYRNYEDEYGTKRIETTKYVTDREECDIQRKIKITYDKAGCTLRKLKVDLLSENPVSLDIDFGHPIKEVIEKTIYWQQ